MKELKNLASYDNYEETQNEEIRKVFFLLTADKIGYTSLKEGITVRVFREKMSQLDLGNEFHLKALVEFACNQKTPDYIATMKVVEAVNTLEKRKMLGLLR